LLTPLPSLGKPWLISKERKQNGKEELEAWGIWPKHGKAPFLHGSYASFHDHCTQTQSICLSNLQEEKILGLWDTNPNVRAL